MTTTLSQLPNGLRVATDEMDSVESVSVGMWVGVGTRDEPAGANGVAHLLEHMLFKGTRRRSARAIAEEIEAVGGYLNAYTGRDATVYYAKVLTADLPLAVDLLADILQDSVFDPAELDRERGVIVQEIGQALDVPEDEVFDRFQACAFPDQGLGWSILGTPEIVQSVPRAAMIDYLNTRYTAPAMVLTAAGRVDHARFAALAEKAFSRLPAHAPFMHEKAIYRGGEHRDDRALEQVHLVLGFDCVSAFDPDYYASLVLSTLLGGGMSSRLFQEVRENRGLAYSIYATTEAYTDAGLFKIYAGTGRDEAAELLGVVCDQIRQLRQKIEPQEIARATAQLKASILMSLESTATRAEMAGHQMLTFNRPIPPEEIAARIDAVDAAALNRVLTRIRRRPPTLAAIGPLDRLNSLDWLEKQVA